MDKLVLEALYRILDNQEYLILTSNLTRPEKNKIGDMNEDIIIKLQEEITLLKQGKVKTIGEEIVKKAQKEVDELNLWKEKLKLCDETYKDLLNKFNQLKALAVQMTDI